MVKRKVPLRLKHREQTCFCLQITRAYLAFRAALACCLGACPSKVLTSHFSSTAAASTGYMRPLAEKRGVLCECMGMSAAYAGNSCPDSIWWTFCCHRLVTRLDPVLGLPGRQHATHYQETAMLSSKLLARRKLHIFKPRDQQEAPSLR
jgi:hypothetical protein